MNKSKSSVFVKIFKITSEIVGLLLATYLVWLTYASIQYYPTIGALENIKNTRLTMQDVTGETLPPKRTEQEYKATIEGLDENNNGIRDDVEHAIFDMTDDSLQMRAAKLQYAQALQLYFSSVRDGETWAQVMKKISLGGDCVANTFLKSRNSPLKAFDLYDKATINI
ncbi:MAG: hypothetical protein LRZ97_01690, partial [Candidatus Pacebacteria bacterium]|nr:hypothetical protein [Candidatus Paceibacterota bacterium]